MSYTIPLILRIQYCVHITMIFNYFYSVFSVLILHNIFNNFHSHISSEWNIDLNKIKSIWNKMYYYFSLFRQYIWFCEQFNHFYIDLNDAHVMYCYPALMLCLPIYVTFFYNSRSKGGRYLFWTLAVFFSDSDQWYICWYTTY